MQSKIEINKILKKSSLHFVEYVWPVIKDSIGGGYIIPVEGVTESNFAKNLDVIAGIDAWQIFSNDNNFSIYPYTIALLRLFLSYISYYFH